MSSIALLPLDWQAFLRAFKIGSPYEVTVPSQDLLSTVAFITTEQGTFVLKKHWFRRSSAFFAQLAALYQDLEPTGCPVDYLVLPQQRRDIPYRDHEGDLYTVHRFLPGYKLSSLAVEKGRHVSYILNAAEKLADYHSYARLVTIQSEFEGDEGILPLLFTKGAGLKTQIERNVGGKRLPGWMPSVLGLCEWLEGSFASIPFPEPKQVLVHGDFRPGNLLFDHGTVTGIIDWDFLQFAPRLVDIFGCFFCELALGRWGSVSPCRFIQSYAAASKRNRTELSLAEISLAPLFALETIIRLWVVLPILLDRIPLKEHETLIRRRRVASIRLQEAGRLLSWWNEFPWDHFRAELMEKC